MNSMIVIAAIVLIFVVVSLWIIFGVEIVYGDVDEDLEGGRQALNDTLKDLIPKLLKPPLSLQGA